MLSWGKDCSSPFQQRNANQNHSITLKILNKMTAIIFVACRQTLRLKRHSPFMMVLTCPILQRWSRSAIFPCGNCYGDASKNMLGWKIDQGFSADLFFFGKSWYFSLGDPQPKEENHSCLHHLFPPQALEVCRLRHFLQFETLRWASLLCDSSQPALGHLGMSESHFLICCVQKHWSLFHSGMERKMVEISCLGCAWQAVGSSPRETAAWRTHVRRQKKSEKEGAAEEKSEKEWVAERNHCALTPSPCTAHGLTKGSATCSDNKGSGDQEGERRAVWSEPEPGKGREKVFSLSIEMFVVFVSQCLNQ